MSNEIAVGQSSPEPFVIPKESFVIDGMDLTHYVPRYKIISQRKSNNGTFYNLRSNSCKTIWMNSLYPALENFMLYLGYEPTETFEYLHLNGHRKKKNTEALLRSDLWRRLEMKRMYQIVDGCKREYLYITARFVDNDPDLNFGFTITFYARKVDLIIHGNHQLALGDVQYTPTDFVYQLLLTMKYPKYMYETQKKHGTMSRLVREYADCSTQRKGTKYEPWGF